MIQEKLEVSNELNLDETTLGKFLSYIFSPMSTEDAMLNVGFTK